jgi:hypothetical protein
MKASLVHHINDYLGCNRYGMGYQHTQTVKVVNLLTSQQLNLEDHAASEIHMLGLFLYGGFSPFRF